MSIVVTGGSGFVGSHVVAQLLKENYTHIGTTVRDTTKKENLISSLKHAGVTDGQLGNLKFFIADLLSDDGWKEAFEGVKFLLHIASPIALFEKDKIKTAKEGTLRVLNFARDSGVKRIVVTSSGLTFIPLMKDFPFAEYHESKIVADKAVWEWHEKEGGNLEIISVHPQIILGPILGPQNARQLFMIDELLHNRPSPMGPSSFPVRVVDVRDVADLHIRALTTASLAVGKGQGKVRLIASADELLTWTQITQILHDKLPAEYGKNITIIPVPAPDAGAGHGGPPPLPGGEGGKPPAFLEQAADTSASKALGWKPHSAEETILDTANSLIAFGLVK